MPRKRARGDCGEVAAKLLLTDQSLILVHGYPVGRGDENWGVRYFHAWVETDDAVVIDQSNGLDITIPRDAYYRLGQLGEEFVRRYTFEEARDRYLGIKHYGPWDEDWREADFERT